MLMFRTPIPRRIEIRGKLSIDLKDFKGLDALADIYLGWSFDGFVAFQIHPQSNSCQVFRGPRPTVKLSLTLRPENDFVIRLYDGFSQVSFNGAVVYESQTSDDNVERSDSFFGIG